MRKLLILWLMAAVAALPVQAQIKPAVDPDLASALQAAIDAVANITTSGAMAVIPSYSATSPLSALAGQNLQTAAQQRMNQCALTPTDPVCGGAIAAVSSAAAPRGAVDQHVLDAARAVLANPGATIADVAAYYSGCSAAGSCPPTSFCFGVRCFNTSTVGDTDFAAAMTYMEAAREAGVYLDPATLRVFSGESQHCSRNVLKDCCGSGSPGGMDNGTLFNGGSKLVYDVLMDADNREFVKAGLNAMITGSGFAGTYTAYGFTYAAGGVALPAGSVTLAVGEWGALAFNPVTLVIMIVILVVMKLMECSDHEGKLSMKEGARLCKTVGEWCSKCIRVLGACVSCVENTTGKCCYNSVLGRLINEQGRTQLGMSYGSPESPSCEGFTIAELQRLDFSRMDLSEFYSSIVPQMPDATAVGAGNAAKVTKCYYGGGKC